MKNALTQKIIAAVMALFMLTSLAACGGQNVEDAGEPSAPASSAADAPAEENVSGSDTSYTDVSATDVSASDVPVVDDAAAADSVLNAYFDALNSGDADKLVELTCSQPLTDYLEAAGLGADYLRASYQATVDGMKSVSGGYRIAAEFTAADATEEELAALAAAMDALSAGAGAKVQAVRIYKVNMKAYAAEAADVVASIADVISNTDLVSIADAVEEVVSAELLEESESVLRLYKYADVWYVYGA